LIVYGLALTILIRSSKLIPFIWPCLREGGFHYLLMDPFSNLIMPKEPNFFSLG
jgi:hypothetical protein